MRHWRGTGSWPVPRQAARTRGLRCGCQHPARDPQEQMSCIAARALSAARGMGRMRVSACARVSPFSPSSCSARMFGWWRRPNKLEMVALPLVGFDNCSDSKLLSVIAVIAAGVASSVVVCTPSDDEDEEPTSAAALAVADHQHSSAAPAPAAGLLLTQVSILHPGCD